jgi:hypothetical protein
MGSVPDPLFDQSSATTLASFSKRKSTVRSKPKKLAVTKLKAKSMIRKRGRK